MGSEAKTTLRRGRLKETGMAELEGGHLVFKGATVRLKIPFSGLIGATQSGTLLEFDHDQVRHSLELGAKAAKWLAKIKNPPTLLDKLGIKPESRVCVLGVADPTFKADLAARVGTIRTKPQKDSDVIVLGIDTPGELAKLGPLKSCLKPNGAIWVVHPKGKGAAIKDVDVFAAAKRIGLVDNKVAAFSLTHTAERLVIPLALRGETSKRR